MIRRPPRSTLDRSSAASDVYKRQVRVRRRPAAAAVLVVSAVAPVLLIQALGITRFALPKYVIYLLPVSYTHLTLPTSDLV